MLKWTVNVPKWTLEALKWTLEVPKWTLGVWHPGLQQNSAPAQVEVPFGTLCGTMARPKGTQYLLNAIQELLGDSTWRSKHQK